MPSCIVTTMDKKQLQPILRTGGPEALTYTEITIRIWKRYTYINLNMEHYIRDRIKLLTFYDIIIVNNKNYHFIGQFSTLLYLRH